MEVLNKKHPQWKYYTVSIADEKRLRISGITLHTEKETANVIFLVAPLLGHKCYKISKLKIKNSADSEVKVP